MKTKKVSSKTIQVIEAFDYALYWFTFFGQLGLVMWLCLFLITNYQQLGAILTLFVICMYKFKSPSMRIMRYEFDE